MKKIAPFFLLLFSLKSIAQADDELGNMLKGTTVLTGSDRNQTTAFFYGFCLDSLYASPCISLSEEPASTQIAAISFPSDSMLLVKTLVKASCSHDFLGEIEIVEDSILNLIYHEYGGRAICPCSYELTYQIRLNNAAYYPNVFDKVKYAMIQSERTTMKTVPWKK